MSKKTIVAISCLITLAIVAGAFYLFYLKPQVCPMGYIDFDGPFERVCVAKYEMKQASGGIAVSRPTGAPWVNISRPQAIEACKKNGDRYDLISNEIWTLLARDIASVPENWSSGAEYIGRINNGHAYKTPNRALEASPDDNNSCYLLDTKCTRLEWKNNRRTHALPDNTVIWDFAGNVSEWIKDVLPVQDTETFIGFSLAKFQNPPYSRFGPITNCDNPLVENMFCGYGVIQNIKDPRKTAVARGGHWNQAGPEVTGIFTTSIALRPKDQSPSLGFRCIYKPLKGVTSFRDLLTR